MALVVGSGRLPYFGVHDGVVSVAVVKAEPVVEAKRAELGLLFDINAPAKQYFTRLLIWAVDPVSVPE